MFNLEQVTPAYARVSRGLLVPSRDAGARIVSQMRAKWNSQQYLAEK